MSRKGFVDLRAEGFAFEIYVFETGPAGHEYKSSITYSDGSASSLPESLNDIKEFYLGLPVELLDFRILRLPFSDRSKLVDVIPFELDTLIIDGSNSVIFDFIVLGAAEDKFDVLVAYMKKDMLKDILEKFSSLNIDPRIITSTGLRTVIKGDAGDILKCLAGPEETIRDERVRAAGEELQSHTINLRRGIFAYTKDAEKFGKAFKVSVVLLILLALLINSDLAFRIVTAKQETASLKREIRNVYAGLFPGEKRISNELYQMKSHLKEIQEKDKALTGVYPLKFMLELSRKNPGVKFNEISLDRDMITMKGEAGSMDEITRMQSALSEFLSGVSISDIKPSEDGGTSFTVVAEDMK